MTSTKTLILGFWDAVVECLVQFHGIDHGQAYLLTLDLRRRLAVRGARLEEVDLFYHEEPFKIACTLANHELDIDKHWGQYEAILDRAYGPATASEKHTAQTTLLEFYATRAPSTDVERVTVLTAYLRDHLGQNEITAELLYPLILKLTVHGQQPMKSITHGLWNAASKSRSYLERVEGKRGTYRLTNAGAALVYVTLRVMHKAREGKPIWLEQIYAILEQNNEPAVAPEPQEPAESST